MKLTLPGGQFSYFRYNLTTQTELVFQLQRNSYTGDPDLFVSKSYDRPNHTTHEWQGTTTGADLVRIPNAATGTYYISVRAWGFLAVTFSLTAKVAQSKSEMKDSNFFSINVLNFWRTSSRSKFGRQI
jgi:hypothetical protein